MLKRTKILFKEKNLNSILIGSIFLSVSVWWGVVNFLTIKNLPWSLQVWSSSYQVSAILGFYLGFFILLKKNNSNYNILPIRTIQFFSLGLILQALGQSVYSYYTVILGVVIPYPSFGDVFYLLSEVFYLFGVFTIVFYAKKNIKWISILSAIFLLIFGYIQIIFLRRTGYIFKILSKNILDYIYIVVETSYLSIAIACLLLSRHFKNIKFRVGLVILLYAAIFQFIAEFNFFYTARIGTWVDGSIGDYLYLVAYTITSLGLVQFTSKFVAINILACLFNAFFFIRFVLSGSVDRYLMNGVLLLISLFGSYLLLKHNKNEIKERENIAKLKALEESHAKLQELDKQKTEFLNIAAHQLRTPVSIIRNYVAMIQDGDFGPVSPEIKGVLNNIYDSNQWLVRLADEFLDISRLESGQTKYNLATGDFSKTVEEVVVDISSKAIEKGLELKLEIKQKVLEAAYDSEKMRHVILNFVENSIKYTEKGSIVVKVEKVENTILFSVSDTGIGFTQEDAVNFFQKFHRGKKAYEIEVNTSTGLGLYICRKFVEGHGGKVWAKSAGTGKGSEFGFWIPA